MPKRVRIPAGSTPAPVTVEDMEAAVDVAEEAMEMLRHERIDARGDDVTPAERRRILADTDDAYTAAIEAHNQALKTLHRAVNGGNAGQSVPLGTVAEVEVSG